MRLIFAWRGHYDRESFHRIGVDYERALRVAHGQVVVEFQNLVVDCVDFNGERHQLLLQIAHDKLRSSHEVAVLLFVDEFRIFRAFGQLFGEHEHQRQVFRNVDFLFVVFKLFASRVRKSKPRRERSKRNERNLFALYFRKECRAADVAVGHVGLRGVAFLDEIFEFAHCGGAFFLPLLVSAGGDSLGSRSLRRLARQNFLDGFQLFGEVSGEFLCGGFLYQRECARAHFVRRHSVEFELCGGFVLEQFEECVEVRLARFREFLFQFAVRRRAKLRFIVSQPRRNRCLFADERLLLYEVERELFVGQAPSRA